MNPLAVEIWLSMLGAYVMVSLTIWVVARFSPREWSTPRSCWLDSDDDTTGGCEQGGGTLMVMENDFTLANSFWFTIGSLMQQGSDLNPKVTHYYCTKYCDYIIIMSF
jgi:ionotropic glutamate receptor